MRLITKLRTTLLLLCISGIAYAATNQTDSLGRLFNDGQYYIYNVGMQKYLAAGDSWGTHAIVNETGLDFELVCNNGMYTIDSQVANNNSAHYLNGAWTDGQAYYWTFNEVEDGVYTISDGANYLTAMDNDIVDLSSEKTDGSLWKLKTLRDRLAELNKATENAPVDATFLIMDANFGRNDLRRAYWSISASNWNLSGGNNMNNCAESYHSAFTLTQTLHNAPAGKYEMTAQGFYRDDADGEPAPVFFANDKTTPFPMKMGSENSMTHASASFTDGLYTIDPIKVTTYDYGQLSIGAQGTAVNQWVIWDNFRLMYYGNQVDLTDVINDYMEALANAQRLLLDSGYVNVTGTERTTLAQIIRDYGNVDKTDQNELIKATNVLERTAMNFTSVVTCYDNFANVKANVDLSAYPYASQDLRGNLNGVLLIEPKSADEASELATELGNMYRKYVYSNSLLEGVSEREDVTDAIYNPMAYDYTDGWETILGEGSGGEITVLSNERPYNGYDEIINYFDGGNWSASAWDVTFQQNISLSAGKYMLTVMSRASEEMVSFRLFAGDKSTEMTRIGAQNGIYGNGWNDASIIFELKEDTEFPVGVQGVTTYLHNWMSFTNFRLMRFSDEQNFDEPVDMTSFILNSGFDTDLTWNADGSKKVIIDESVVLSNRSIAAVSADSTVYAIVNPETIQSRPDGRTFEATNGFKGRIKGWTLETNGDFPSCEWTFFGSLPYALEDEAIPVADDGSTYITVPMKPEAADGDDNVGFVYMRAGWGGRAIYKQTVKLPCAQYRLEYWSINLNPNGYNGKNLSKITCRNDVWYDETGFSSTEWIKHEIEFTPTAEFTMEFGFESSGGSASNPFLCIDGIKLYKIGEADQQILQKQDLEAIIAELDYQISNVGNAGLKGVVTELQDAAALVQSAYENDDLSAVELENALKICRTTIEKASMAMAQINSISSLIEKMDHVANATNYPGKQNLQQAIYNMNYYLWSGNAEEILSLFKYGQDALSAYYQSQQPTAESPADYTYLITHPWFIDESAEPYVDDNGGYVYPNAGSYIETGSNDLNPDLTMQGWIWWRGGSMSGWDLRTNWVQGRSCFNAWYRSAYDSWAAIVQDLTNVPEGYYTLSADMLTQEGCVTDQHVFATYTSYNVDRYAESFDSPSLTEAGWSDDGNPVWTTLTTPVFYVGPDGILTIGARGNHHVTTDSLVTYTSEGWFLATNFRLNYYGLTEPEQPIVEEHNSLYIADGLRLSKTKTNMLPISLQNEDVILGFQLDVVLPDGMMVAFDDDAEDYVVTCENTRAKNHSLSCNEVGNGTIRIVGTSLSNKKIASGDDILLNMGINIASWVDNGDYAIQLKNVKLTNIDKKTLTCSDKTFVVTVGGKLGDVNHDEAVDVTDAVLIIDDILLKNPSNYDASLADVNSDGYIDVTDVVMVIDAILGKIELSRGAELIDRSAYTAFQMDLTIPAGYVLESVTLTDIAKDSHSLAYNMLPDGRCRVVVCSMNNEALPGAWDEVISLNLRGKGDAQVNIDRAVFVTIDGERHELMMNPTSIAQISNLKSQASNLYDLQGRKVEKASKGILIENGKKIFK